MMNENRFLFFVIHMLLPRERRHLVQLEEHGSSAIVIPNHHHPRTHTGKKHDHETLMNACRQIYYKTISFSSSLPQHSDLEKSPIFPHLHINPTQSTYQRISNHQVSQFTGAHIPPWPVPLLPSSSQPTSSSCSWFSPRRRLRWRPARAHC